MKTLLVVLATAFLATQAQAVSLTFKFKAYGSAPDIYACNAGLLTKATTSQICYIEGTQTSCNPGDCSAGTSCESQCKCSGAEGGGYLMNYGKAIVQDWKDKGNGTSTGVATKTFKAGQTSYATALTDTDAWTKRVRELTFNLGSELYNASYFVDVCYRGPQIPYYADGITANFSIQAQASATDFIANGTNPGDITIPGTVDGKKYSELSGLTMQSYLVCDVQGQGTYQNADAGGVFNGTTTEAIFTIGSVGLPTGGGDLFMQSSTVAATTAASNLITGYITNNSAKTPRFCKVRYVFSETNVSSTLPNLRKWQLHGAEMCTYTKIEEDAN
jgi:hypothetical protein